MKRNIQTFSSLEGEVWRTLAEHPEYQVSNLGRVYSLKTNREMKPDITSAGYSRVTLGQTSIRSTIHRLVAEAFLDNPFEYPVVNHKDHNRLNNTLSNLEWCTRTHNNVHSQSTRFFVVSPEGEVFEVYGARPFAREHDLHPGRLLDVAYGKYKSHRGWKLLNKP